MNEKETRDILKREKLENYNLFENRPLKENETVIKKTENNNWDVFVTSEKGNPGGVKTYSDKDIALDDFVERLRADKRLREYFKD